jgi:TolB-like protein
MPFANGGGAELQYLADGLTESLIGDLSQVPGLKVISRNSVFRYKGREDPALIGAALKAEAVLVGQLTQKGDRLSVQIELVDVRDNHRMWGERYNPVWADLLQTRVEISKEVLSKLRVTLSSAKERDLARRQKINPEAYRLYLKGLFYFRRYGDEDIRSAADCFHQALLEDPAYALAYVGLADLSVALAEDSRPPKEEMPRAREYALKALDLYGSLAEAHVALGLVKLLYDWDWQGAEREFKYDSQVNPDSLDTFSCYLHSADTLGRTGEAFAKLTRLLTRDPMSPLYNLELGCIAYYARQYNTTISQYWRTVALDPGLILAYVNVGRAYAQKQMYGEAIAELEKGRKLDSGSPVIVSELAHTLAASGKRKAARTILNELRMEASRRYVDPYLLAPVYLQLAEPDEAFKWLDKAYADRSSYMPWLKLDPELDSVRSDPRYRDLLLRVGLY